MTAITVVRQPRHRCLQVLTDGAIYLNDGTVVGKGSKVFTVPSWPGVVTTRGPALATAMIGQGLSIYLHTFDDAVDGIERVLPAFAANCAPLIEGMGLDAIEVVIAGWSEKRNRPESYMIAINNGIASELAALPDVASGPDLDLDSDVCRAAGYTGLDPDDAPAHLIRDLRLSIECQRRTITPYLGNDIHSVGCFGQLTTVTPDAIEQRIIVRWDEDRVGEKIAPTGSVRVTPVIPEGMSRLQRERMEKKARKGTLKVVA